MDQFKGKKITIMGLGLLGGAMNDAIYLAEHKAHLLVTDLKTPEQLKLSVQKLRKYKNIQFILGRHRMEDFKNTDMIIQPGNVPVDSPYLVEAKKNNVPVFVSESLFVKYAEGVILIGVTGTRGKSTTSALIYDILSKNLKGKKVSLGGNVRNISTLALLNKVKRGDIVVMELDSWALHGIGDIKTSPHVSVFTTFFPDHMNYYKSSMRKYFDDKANTFKFQKKEDLLVVGKQALPFIEKWGGKIKSKMIVGADKLPKGWKFNLPGFHNEYNAMLAVEVARSFSIPDIKIKKALATFIPLSGRLEFLRSINGIKIYNDNSSTTPEATVAALRALGNKKKRNIVLIIGGDKKFLNMSKLLLEIPKFCSKVVLFKEKGTDLICAKVFKFSKKGIDIYEEEGLSNTVKRAFSVAKKGETILYSPAFSSFGKYFSNEYDRGDKFMKIVKSLE